MKIKVKDFKKRKHLQAELAKSLKIACLEIFGTESPTSIKEVRISVRKRFPTAEGYNRAFARLYKEGIVNLILTPGYDLNPATRLSLIGHELSHVKQFISGELKFIYQPQRKTKLYIYKNRPYSKVYSLAKFDSYTNRKAQINYISKICPWEREPSLTADRLSPWSF